MTSFVSAGLNGREYLINIDHIVAVGHTANGGRAYVRLSNGDILGLDNSYEMFSIALRSFAVTVEVMREEAAVSA